MKNIIQSYKYLAFLFILSLQLLVVNAQTPNEVEAFRSSFFKTNSAESDIESGLLLLRYYSKTRQIDSVSITLKAFQKIHTELFRTYKFNFQIALALDGDILAKPFLIRTLSLSKEKGDSLYIALSQLYIGSLDSLDNYHEERSRLLFGALTYLEKVKYKEALDRAYYEVASLYLDMKDTRKAKEYLLIADSLAEKNNNAEMLALVANDLGNVYYYESDFEASLQEFNKSLKYYYNEKSYKSIALIESNLSIVLEELGDEEAALMHAKNALASRVEYADTFGISGSCINIAYFYKLHDNYDSALLFLEKAIVYAKLKDRQDVLNMSYSAVSQIFEQQGKYQDALHYYKKYKQLNDSIYRNDRYEMVQKYEAEKDIVVSQLRNKIQIQAFENKIERNTMLIGALILLLVLVLIILLIVYRSSRVKKKFSNEILKNLKFLETLIETVPDPIFYRDDKGLFVGCNRAFTQLVGKEKGRIIGYSQKQVYDKPYLKDFIQNDNGLLSKNENSQYNKTYNNKNGEKIYLQFRNASFRIPNINSKGIIGLIIDMTKQKNIEKQLIKANETKELFISIISHDIRNSFNAVLAFTSLLHEDYDFYNDEKRIELIGNIHEASNNTFLLLENLLGWSRSQQGGITINKQPTDVKDIIEESLALLRPASNEKHLSIINHLDSYELLIDENSIKTVFRNLISNAIKYSHSGGEINIYSEIVDKCLKIYIKDNGVGIEAENIEHLFKLNKKTQKLGTKNESGSGLGLLLSRELLQLNQGRISVESEFGKGSSFVVSLPM